MTVDVAEELTDIERDALAEIANMGVSRAATSLRQMVGEQVLLSVPAVNIVTRETAARLVEKGGSPKLVAVQQTFDGPFAGQALLIFPQAQSLELVRAIVGPDHSLEDVIDLEQEALAETGNIILNACLATIANVLRRTMRMSLPAVVRGDGATLFEVRSAGASSNLVLFLFIDFTIKNRSIHGFIALLMDLPSITKLKEIVGDYIDGIAGKLTMLDNVPVSEFDAVFDALDVGIIVLDPDGVIVGWNDWVARVTGKSRHAVVGENLYAVFPALQTGRLPSVINETFEAGSSSILTHSLNTLLPLRGADGQELLHNIVVRPIAYGPSRHCLLQINDVTLAVTRERVLRERQNARYHAIVDSAPDAMITTSLDRTIQWVNGAAERVFKYAASELLGQKVDILLAQDGDVANAFGVGPAPQRAAGPLQVVGRRKDGRIANFEVSFGQWEADDRLFVTSLWRDVTERMLAEAAVRESENRHRTLSEALPQLVWTCGPDGHCDYFNPQWQTYTGADIEDHLGWGWINAIHHEDRASFKTAWETSLANGDVFDVDARLRHASNTYRCFKFRSIPVGAADGSISRWFGTATDITDHVDAREALRRSNEELEALVLERTRERESALSQLHESQKMETIGQLTGGVAHDFNNLLAVILGSLSLLKKSVPDDPRTSRLLEGAIQGAERGATLTKRLLAFARRQELKLEAVEVQKLVPEMLDFLRQSVGPSIAIMVDIPPDVYPVKIDANQLELALMNLAVNGRDAMPKGGTLTITCRNETDEWYRLPKTLARGDYVRVSVVDSGSGMSEATLAKAMEPFFTTKGIGKGTGLGLSMVHGLTAQCGGAMSISSQLGKGTVVSLWLPRAYAGDAVKLPEPQVARAPDFVGRRLNILSVDDDSLVSMNTVEMLTDLGHSVHETHSAANALQALETAARFDVVLTDYAMPGMNGLDLALKIKQMKPGLPVILATGYSDLPLQTSHGFPRLAKPYSQEELAEVLGKIVQGTP